MKTRAIIVDLDGTLTDNTHRLHMLTTPEKDWVAINEHSRYDLPVLWCQEMVQMYHNAGYKILFVTGRAAFAESITREWLTRYIGPLDYQLYMRPLTDTREDFIVKQEIFQRDILPFYDVAFALEDRDSVTRMWRDIGVTCLQVKDSTY
jgi:hypothetical protein